MNPADPPNECLYVFPSPLKAIYLFAEENLALQRPTTQSDILWSYGPDLAVDGDPNTCSFTTRQEGQRWWQVSLSVSQSVSIA